MKESPLKSTHSFYLLMSIIVSQIKKDLPFLRHYLHCKVKQPAI